jgi:transposase InsO family protein
MTDNGSCYKSKAFGEACRRFGIKHIRTKPYTPVRAGEGVRRPASRNSRIITA